MKEFTVLASVGEIWLKGDNRGDFLRTLRANLAAAARRRRAEIDCRRLGARLLCSARGEREVLREIFASVPGVENFSFVRVLRPEMSALLAAAGEALRDLREAGERSVAFRTTRTNKDFPLTSPEINSSLGEAAAAVGLRVDYRGAARTLYTVIEKENIFLAAERETGLGGLPVGTGGRVLLLLSGGIDSPVAAFELLKRGARVDYLHLHSLRENGEVFRSKITRLVEILSRYQPSARLFVAPYLPFDLAVSGAVPPGMEVVFFKNFTHRLAAALAEKENCQAIANGDNLAQVASQTIWNMRAASYGVEALILRPLLTAAKTDIIAAARRIGTYETSTQPYKDCCSLTAKRPRTRVNFDRFRRELADFPMERTVSETLAQIDCRDFS